MARKRSSTRRFKLLMGFALSVLVAWSIFWFVAATILDRQVLRIEHAAVAEGIVADCVGRRVAGFPFRLEMRCQQGSRFGDENAIVSVGGTTLTALVYNPSRIIAEVQGPMTLGVDGMPGVVAEWDLAHASARLDLADHRLTRMDAEVVAPRVTLGDELVVEGDEVDLNLRADQQVVDAVEFALRVAAAKVNEMPEPVALAMRGTAHGVGSALKGTPELILAHWQDEGLVLELDEMTLVHADAMVRADGTLTLRPDGLLDGALTMALAGYDTPLPQLARFAPDHAESVQRLVTNLLNFAPKVTVDGRTARRLDVVIDKGTVRAGIVPLFKIPPLVSQPR